MLRRGVNLAFKAVGTVVALSTVIKGVTKNGFSNPGEIPRDVSYEVLGFDPQNPQNIDWSKPVATAGGVIAGLVIMKLGSYIARKW